MYRRRVKVYLKGGNDQTFYPGSEIAGTVNYKSTAEDRLTSVSVNLHGYSKVKADDSKSKEKLEFFHISQILHREDSNILTKPTKAETWDFSFRIPEEEGPDLSETYLDGGNPLFKDKSHTLPPNLKSSKASIQYRFYATVKRAFRKISMSENMMEEPISLIIKSLNYLPVRPQRAPSLELNPVEQQLQPHSSSGSHSDADSGPPIVIAEVPKLIVAGRPIQIDFSTRAVSEIGPQTVAYKAVAISIVTATHRRTTKKPHTEAVTETKVKELRKIKLSGAAPLDSAKAEFPSQALLTFPPSFKSYSIAVSYELQIDVLTVLGKRDIKVRLVSPIELQHPATEESELARRTAQAPAFPAEAADEEPPSYEGDSEVNED